MWDTTFGITKVVKNYAPSKREKLNWGYQLKRVSAELKLREGASVPLSQPIVRARVVLCDFRPKWIGLFTEAAIPTGHEIALTIEDPVRFFCFGKVVYSGLVPHQSHIISFSRFDYRTCVEIVFQSKEEFYAIRRYTDELRHGAKKLAKVEPLSPILVAA